MMTISQFSENYLIPDVIVLVSECSHEHFCPNAAETCIKSAACSDNITGRLEKTGENRNRTIFIAPRRLYFHGFEGRVVTSGQRDVYINYVHYLHYVDIIYI